MTQILEEVKESSFLLLCLRASISKKIADVIWDQVVAPVASLGNQTVEIWERQIKQFWEIHWVIGEEPDLLHRRKYWRDFIPTIESGDKCMLFSHLQELSGYVGSGNNAKDRAKQQKFWAEFRSSIEHPLDLGETERLSAIGTIKRFLPVYAKDALGWGLPEDVRFFPSTQVLASLPWRKRVLNSSTATKQAKQYANESKKIFPTTISARRFFPGNETHPWVLMDHRAINPIDLESVPFLKEKFSVLCHTVGSEPSSYYALLLMDGDQLGNLLQIPGQSKMISQALADFTQSVAKIVTDDHQGILIYAGGDDVFALFPYDTVLSAAIQLKEKYRQSFINYAPSLRIATISASVVFANQKTPFQQVIPYAHEQLNLIAKEKHGRNSLVVSLYNQSGEIVHWAAPWEKAICPEQGKTQLEVLAESLPLSQSFLYQCKHELEPLSAVLPNEELSQIAIGEWERINQQATPQDREAIAKFIDLGSFSCYQKKHVDEVGTVKTFEHQFSADVARLIGWLRQRMDER